MTAASIEVETVEVRTAYGPIAVTGNFAPEVKALVITGMRAPLNAMERIPIVLAPEFGGLVAHLPGHYTPQLSETSLAAFASAFDEVAAAVGASTVMGMSVGALVALSMRAPSIRTVVAVEPPLETAKLWQLVSTLKATASEHADFYREFLGFDGHSLNGKTYLHLLDEIERPTAFVVGDKLPFPARSADLFLSVVDEAQRILMARAPNATLHVAEGAGHAVHRHAAGRLQEVLLAACRRAGAGADAHRAS